MTDAVQLQKRAAHLSLALGALLFLLKFVAYLLTDSSAIFSDALESIVNVIAAGFAVYAIHLSNMPADREHPYGHGKIEFISAAFEGGMIVIAALVIVAHAISILRHPPTYQSLDLGMLLMLIALLANGAAGLYLVRIGQRSQSLALEADGQHLIADAATSAMVIVAMLLVRLLGWRHADPICAIAIACYISIIGWRLVRRSTAGLMDEQDESDRKLLEGILNNHIGPQGKAPQICSYHKLRHRHSGRYHWVDFHLVVPGDWSVEIGHRIASTIEYEIEQTLKYANATAHVEPCRDSTCIGLNRPDEAELSAPPTPTLKSTDAPTAQNDQSSTD